MSASLTTVPDDNVVAAPCSVYDALAATLLRTGAASTAVIATVVVCAALDSVPSLTTQLMVRLVSAPKFVGLLLDPYVTLSRTDW